MSTRAKATGWKVLLLMAASGTAWAHHSFGMFDMQKTVTIIGTVKDFQWTNPHVWIDVVVPDATTNQSATWSVEGGSTAILMRMGWSRNALKPGDKVTVVLNPLRTGAIGGSLVSASIDGAPIGHGYEP
jgi:hypothetical protein